ncbi:exported hypothetical protein [Cupriavidus taiwanensis]|nr:exported hypothetical protein [Cupriavidus taiwanensis]
MSWKSAAPCCATRSRPSTGAATGVPQSRPRSQRPDARRDTNVQTGAVRRKAAAPVFVTTVVTDRRQPHRLSHCRDGFPKSRPALRSRALEVARIFSGHDLRILLVPPH